MSSELAHAVAALRELVGSDGKTYQLSPITLDDFGAIDVWLSEYVILHTRRIYQSAPQPLRDKAMEIAYSRADNISFTNRDGIRTLATPAGVAKILWYSLVKKHPTITEDDVKKLVTAETLVDIHKKLDEANRLSDPTKSSDAPSPAGGAGTAREKEKNPSNGVPSSD